jgi:hypothetical protein
VTARSRVNGTGVGSWDMCCRPHRPAPGPGAHHRLLLCGQMTSLGVRCAAMWLWLLIIVGLATTGGGLIVWAIVDPGWEHGQARLNGRPRDR